MQTYQCSCGNRVFFDNCACLRCGHELAFCPGCRNVSDILPLDGGRYTCATCKLEVMKCRNNSEHRVCNRAVAAAHVAEHPLCDCCRLNDTIPDLSVEGNLGKWFSLEAAKRRLFYELDELGLPWGRKEDGIEPELRFDFKSDIIPDGDMWRSLGKKEKVMTGHDDGRITINIREADDVEREKLRVDMNEAHRTLIGHFRHEIGHYYWDLLVKGRREAECIAVFGDHNNPGYDQALTSYYQTGPRPDWRESFVSAYATMHPWEDFAETWATYLDMIAALDTAEHVGFGGQTDAVHAQFELMVARYQELGLALNELNRTMGLIDLVPEVLVTPVVVKLRFIHELIVAGRDQKTVFHANQQVAAAALAGVTA